MVRSISALKFPIRRISAPDDVLTSIVIGSIWTGACFRLDFALGIEAADIRPEPDIIGRNRPDGNVCRAGLDEVEVAQARCAGAAGTKPF